MNEQKYFEILTNKSINVEERTSYGVGEMISALYDDEGNQLAVRVFDETGEIHYYEGE